MFRTIYMAIYFIVYLIFLFPKEWKINKLEKEGRMQEMHDLLHKIAMNWGKSIVNATGSKIHVFGIENIPKGPVLFVSNHQGNFDIPILFGFIDKPKAFIAKIELSKIPVFGKWMERQKCIFIDRDNPRQSLKAINKGIKTLKDGHSMVIFPEGTRSKGPKMGEFKKGSLKLATKAKVPIVPITIDGSYKIMEGNKKLIKPAEVKVTISQPIHTTNLTKEDENVLSEKVYAIIKSHLS
ncbi:1-acyl-sn-glycerol-3-phosphate acyltransferase [Crassaminicella thermophila]|uniref:1-acyl-sn-glycerol-3-phosphate acyltransferase n=2 Tax=Crassaminicella thermophila TaxID=2599308 RepID=A0A5C0SIA0_CRATE|nr:lysophospholipid acyltransferase family protein [Crassaminicella thermophila]QEK13712.1 1-acyl-sn-glycerol-3-phosphate acyltransferase [Crassaminicella thermophila]